MRSSLDENHKKVLRIEAQIFGNHIRKRDIRGEAVHRGYMIGNRHFKHSLVLVLRSYINSTTYLNSRDFNLRRNGKMKLTSEALFRVGILRNGKAGGEIYYNLIYKQTEHFVYNSTSTLVYFHCSNF
jgi:hypothetical protein